MINYLNDIFAIERLKKEYNEHKNLIIGFDFDDTIFPYHDNVITFEVVNLLKKCKKLGFTLCLWSTCSRPNDIKYKVEICNRWDITPDYINKSPLYPEAIKPYFSILLDDRAGLSASYNILLTTLKELNLYEN